MTKEQVKKIISERLDYYLELNKIDNVQITDDIVDELEDKGLEIEDDFYD